MRTRLLKLFSFFALSLVFVTIACGGGGGSSAPTTTSPSTYSISGVVSGAVQSGVSVVLSPGNLSATTTTNGTYTFTGVANGSYTVTPSLSGYTFSPTSASAVVNGANVSAVNFTATTVVGPPSTYSISGVVTDAGSVGTQSGVSVVLSPGNLSATTTTNGTYTFTGVANGSYTVTPSLSGYTFSPTSASAVVNGANVSGVNFTATANTNPSAYSLYWIRITPNTLFDDEFQTAPVTIEASASGSGFTLYAKYLTATFDSTLPSTVASVLMSDTGALDNDNPGAHIYKATFTTGLVPRLRYYGNTVDELPIWLEAHDSAGNGLNSVNLIGSTVELGVVSRSLAVNTTQLSSDVFVTPNMVNVVVPVLGNDYTVVAMKKVYTYYPDVFDTAVIQSIRRTFGTNLEQGGPIKNAVSGINVPIVDNSAGFGSSGALSSMEYEMPADDINTVFLHEFGHSACFYLNNQSLNLDDFTKFHAAMIGTVGQMGGNYLLAQQADGSYLVTYPDNLGYNSRKYSDLELYLLGFAPPSAVQPMRFALDGTVNYKPGDILPASATMPVTIDDITRVYGVRTPSFATSQKSYRAVFVGVSETPMTPAEVALMNRIAIYYASGVAGQEIDTKGLFPVRSMPSFAAATNGVATLTTALPPLK